MRKSIYLDSRATTADRISYRVISIRVMVLPPCWYQYPHKRSNHVVWCKGGTSFCKFAKAAPQDRAVVLAAVPAEPQDGRPTGPLDAELVWFLSFPTRPAAALYLCLG